MSRASGQLILVVMCLSLAACFDGDDGDLPPAPDGFVIAPAGFFHMGEPDFWDPPGGRRVELTNSFVFALTETRLADYLPLLTTAWRAGEILDEDGWLWHMDSDNPLLAIGDSEQIEFDAIADSFVTAAGVSPSEPVNRINWYGAALYCDWLNRAEGLPESYDKRDFDWTCGIFGDPYTAEGWRLPTEAEWEYVARYPDHRPYPWGDLPADCEFANGRVGPGGATCEDGPRIVGSRSPDGDAYLGPSDLAGNLREWCQDWYASWQYNEPLVDPWDIELDSTPIDKLLRGGSWVGSYDNLASWRRDHMLPGIADAATGFRVVRSWP